MQRQRSDFDDTAEMDIFCLILKVKLVAVHSFVLLERRRGELSLQNVPPVMRPSSSSSRRN